MAMKGYHSYRGRRGGNGRYVVIVLLLLLLAACCAFILLQRYATYSDDGSIYFDLPFLNREEPEETTPPASQEEPKVDLVIDAPEEPEETRPSYGERRLMEMKELPADEAALRETLAAAGANGFVYTVRDNTGLVYYDSAAAIGTAVREGADSREDVGALCALEDVISVARFNCFHDSYYAWANMESAGICRSDGYIWYDDLSYHWLDPAKEAARHYVLSLALECAQMGFDELLLEDLCYPSSGHLEKIDYSGSQMEKTEALELFLLELRQAVEPYGMYVSLAVDEKALAEERDEDSLLSSGLDLQRLLPMADSVWTRTEDVAAAQSVLASLAGGEAPPLVPVVDEMPAAGNGYLPALP